MGVVSHKNNKNTILMAYFAVYSHNIKKTRTVFQAVNYVCWVKDKSSERYRAYRGFSKLYVLIYIDNAYLEHSDGQYRLLVIIIKPVQ